MYVYNYKLNLLKLSQRGAVAMGCTIQAYAHIMNITKPFRHHRPCACMQKNIY